MKLVDIVQNILVEDVDPSIIDSIEERIFGFFLFKPKFAATARKQSMYKKYIKIFYPIVKKLGIDKVKEIYDYCRLYTGTFYGRTNNSLRNGKIPAKVSLLDDYIKYFPKFTGTELLRGVDKETFEFLKRKKSFVDNAFVSTTSDLDTALAFSKKKRNGGILVITGNVRKAAKVLPHYYGLEKVMDDEESEYILPRGSTFVVEKYNENTIWVKVK